MAKEIQTQQSGSNLPAELEKELDADLQADLTEGGFSLPKIKIVHAEQMFKMPDDTAVNSFKGIILNQHGFNICYLNSQGDEIVPPDCVSMNGIQGSADLSTTLSPDGEPVNVFGQCGNCFYNRFGSGMDQGGEPTKGKRCANKAHILIHTSGVGAIVPNILTVSSTSLRAIEAVRSSMVIHRLPMLALLIEFSLEKNSKGQQVWSTLKAECVGTMRSGDITQDDYAMCKKFKADFADQLGEEAPVEVAEAVAAPSDDTAQGKPVHPESTGDKDLPF